VTRVVRDEDDEDIDFNGDGHSETPPSATPDAPAPELFEE
jgi:hypothetical protein